MDKRQKELIKKTSKSLDFPHILAGDYRANMYEVQELLRHTGILFSGMAQPPHSNSEEQARLAEQQYEEDKVVLRHYLEEIVRVFCCEDILKED